MSRLKLLCTLALIIFSWLGVRASFALDGLQPSAATALARAALPRGERRDFGPPPKVGTSGLKNSTRRALDAIFLDLSGDPWGKKQRESLETLVKTQDARFGWLLADLMRFVSHPTLHGELVESAGSLLGIKLAGFDAWHQLTERLIAWDIPAPPEYLRYKRAIFVQVLPDWEPLLQPGSIDWRHVSWGGVRMDDRPFDETQGPCNCIPAADNPKVTKALEATWLEDDAVIFGIQVNGEYRAYPRQIMEVREMVNDTLGGRDLGIPYCTLCGSAQAWLTDALPEGVARPVLRTSGLLIRSNKVMFDLNTNSVFDTFRGNAVTGPLAELGVQLDQVAVVTTTWGAWKAAYPETTVLAEALALGQNFDFRNGRDANGPIFPIGDADPRLAVQEEVLGVVTESGQALAFHVPSVIAALDAGQKVQIDEVQILLDAGGVRAADDEGRALGTHQAFWFAWSQFHPDTRLWPEPL